MRKRFIIIIALFSSIVKTAKAQMDVQFADYTSLKSYYNPAVSGTEGKLNVAGAYSMQMAGYQGAPATMFLSADMPIYFLSPRHGGGLSFMSDVIGMFTTSKISLQYAYNLKLGQKSRIALGANIGMITEKMDGSKVELEDTTDPAFPTSSVDGNSLDFNFGIYYTMPQLWAGLSVMHAMGPTITAGEKYELEFPRSYYFMAGGNIKLKNSLITLQPSCMVMSDLQTWREDVQCKLVYEYEGRKFYGGLGYSPGISTTFMLGGDFHGATLGYSYQMFTNGIGMVNGSHELVVGYLTDLDLFKKGRNKHKSVRWL
ncbi:MAG: type IX secretion system membrane protein PorP/SprF [Bacteroidaceae bacterium]|nr:type IX secretion system membrane protein PorP/SprF [Bacteroidaceae bacterium]